MSALEAQGLEKRYGDRAAVGPLDLAVADGERVVLIGANGSGKTTFIKMAAGVLDPTNGTVLVKGHPAGSLSARAELSFVPDNPVFYDDLSLEEHLQYVAGLHEVTDWRARADDLLARFGLGERAADLPTTFSRGLKQKASLVLALIRPCSLLLVDEPFVGLDAPGREALGTLLADEHRRGVATVVATHQLDHIGAADRCVVLRDGAVIHDGPSTTDEARKLIADQVE